MRTVGVAYGVRRLSWLNAGVSVSRHSAAEARGRSRARGAENSGVETSVGGQPWSSEGQRRRGGCCRAAEASRQEVAQCLGGSTS